MILGLNLEVFYIFHFGEDRVVLSFYGGRLGWKVGL